MKFKLDTNTKPNLKGVKCNELLNVLYAMLLLFFVVSMLLLLIKVYKDAVFLDKTLTQEYQAENKNPKSNQIKRELEQIIQLMENSAK